MRGLRDIAEKIWQVLTSIVQGTSPCLEGSKQFCLSVLKYKEELKPEESREASKPGESLQSYKKRLKQPGLFSLTKQGLGRSMIALRKHFRDTPGRGKTFFKLKDSTGTGTNGYKLS